MLGDKAGGDRRCSETGQHPSVGAEEVGPAEGGAAVLGDWPAQLSGSGGAGLAEEGTAALGDGTGEGRWRWTNSGARENSDAKFWQPVGVLRFRTGTWEKFRRAEPYSGGPPCWRAVLPPTSIEELCWQCVILPASTDFSPNLKQV